ncbi:MAG TPA: excinuclease ABC subunit UvrC [Thermoanaerobaculia bacterium]|nr:excinuclease ABC subunit UvrC [Thermoanaerobaculia bacterium]
MSRSSSLSPRVLDRIAGLPDQPGIYVFLGAEGEPLYVGKAKSLRKRVAAYPKMSGDARLAAMMEEARELEFLVTASESDALLLENTWIKNRQPRYNIRLRDDKTYPYLKLTLRDEYPRLAFTRRIVDDGAEYYGPYLPGGLARRAIKLVQKLFQIRVCRIEIDGKLARPCLYHDMRRCLGPCVAGLTSREEYARAVEEARLFLSGRNDALVGELRRRMGRAADVEAFEEAARLRDGITEIEAISARRELTADRAGDVDIYGVHIAGGNAAVVILVMREGLLLDRRELFWEGAGEVAASRLLSELLPQVYDHTTLIPKEIHLPLPVEGEEALAEWLSARRGSRVVLRWPARGDKAARLTLAARNAAASHRRRFRSAGEGDRGAEALQRHLGLVEPPRHIEGFDISTFHGSQTVASLVGWRDGKMRKAEYRSFNVRGLPRTDDFAAIRQAVERRYRRVLDENGQIPDLILIDGGRGQLNAALLALVELGLEDTPVIALAKREEEIYAAGRPEPLRLPRTDAGLQTLQAIRDEAHRFAVSRHRRRRSRETLRSGFDELQGIGDRRRRLLVQRFGGFRGVQAASREALQAVLGRRLGDQVFDQLREGREVQG